ncbi:MAG TPA: AAA family ATPase [Trebonia sp.]|jgi:exonuclease SbcC
MRPIMLDLHGFASFRDEARVDFADADFFALVGPTGSGKSTVIDAMTFALYGSVPRWGRKGMVSLALSPTVARGTVKLVFEVDRQRYVVARELRRVGGTVNQRAASLERLDDPRGLARPGDQTFPMAKDLDGVNEGVEKLLGLRYDDFIQCVVLPQGQFAAFLHAKPTERQDILLRLLGAEHFRLMMMKANQRASVAAQRASTYGEELLGYADATAEAERDARAAEAALASLGERVAATLPLISARRDALKAADERLRQLRAEAAALSALRVPDGTGRLDADLVAGRSSAETLKAAERGAEAADGAARTALAAGPQRAPLELARAHRAEQARHRAAISGLAAEVNQRGARAAQAAAAAGTAATALDEARVKRDEASRAAAAAAERVTGLTAEHTRLAAVSVPGQVPALDQRRTAATSAVTDAAAALEEAEQADTAAREARATAAPEAPLARAHRDLGDLRTLQDDVSLAEQATARAAAAREAAESALAASEQGRRRCQDDLEQARRAHVVAGLRPHLVAGEPCPVCEQTVATLPAPLPAREVETAQARLAEADRAVNAAQTAAAQSAAAAGKADADRAASAKRGAALAGDLSRILSGPLAAFPLPAARGAAAGHTAATDHAAAGPSAGPSAAADAGDRYDLLTRALAEIDGLDQVRGQAEQAAERAAATAQRARTRHRAAQAQAEQTQAELAAAQAALRNARDPLVELGAPSVEGASLADGWAALARWAAGQARTRSAALEAAREAATAAAGQHKRFTAEFGQAERALARSRDDAKQASDDDQQARARLSQVTARVTELDDLLKDAPGDEQISAQLTLLDQLEAAAVAAGNALQAARAERSKGEAALTVLEDAERAARDQLSAARDRVVALGAPAMAGRGLLDGWTQLVTWASGQAKAREQDATAAEREADTARAGIGELAGQLSADLAGAGIGLPSETVAASAASAVTGALEGARAVTRRVAERRAQAAELTGKQRTAQQEQQVAHLLGNLLQARQFPQWLVSEALDDLVAAASQTLMALSGGQFDLTHDKGDLFVIDHADADSSRSVRTLSGGETFQASLALALALSSQISALAAAGAARLDSIFLDEGFGTLDAETLEVVATTLEALAQGDRMVGVVTHVAELAERVPVRFRVTRNARTSTITREGLPAPETDEP